MASEPVFFALLGASALRSLALGAGVLVLLKMARMRDTRVESALWTLVLLTACAMPLLRLWPAFGFSVPAPPGAAVLAPIVGELPVVARRPSGLLTALSLVYGLIVMAGLARLAIGLALTARLYRLAEPVAEDWARGKAIRASAAVDGPISFAHCILLPADYGTWTEAKRLAVLAHECSHIRRGDFYVQLLACIHRAVFWFSPLAWWLPRKLSELAETACDKAAVDQTNDPAGYAEILLDVCSRVRGGPVVAAMARGPGVARRIEQVLSGAPDSPLGTAGRIGLAAAVLAGSFAVAEGRAAILLHSPADRGTAIALAVRSLTPQADPAPPAHGPHRIRQRAASRPSPVAALGSGPSGPPSDITYNPRALLDAPPAVAVVGALVPTDATDN